MGEEIFGPILPIIPYDTLDQAIDFIRQREKPLALYLFTQSRKTKERILNTCSFGGGCVNDTIIHLATHHMPFGGVGQSGMGSYHGKKSFETFSHYRSIVDKATWLDLPMRYQPLHQTQQPPGADVHPLNRPRQQNAPGRPNRAARGHFLVPSGFLRQQDGVKGC